MELVKTTKQRLRVIVALIAVACLDAPTAPHVPPSNTDVASVMSIEAAAPGTKFHFLPPLARQPSHTGESDPTQKPIVVICTPVSGADEGCDRIVGYFSTDGGTGGESVTYSPLDEHYRVNWKTGICPDGPCNLDLSKVYRIRILIGTVELASTHIQFVSNASELRNASGDVTALVDRGSLPVKFRIEKGAIAVVAAGESAIVGSQGGMVAAADGDVGLSIPAGAVASSASITVEKVEGTPGDFGAFGPVVDLGPDGTTFSAPIELSLQYDPEKLPPGVAADGLGVYTLRDGAWEPVPGVVTSEVDNIVRVSIEHFSVYAVYLRPNNVTGDGAPVELLVGQTTSLTSFVFAHTTVPGSRCLTDKDGSTTCVSYTESYSYPVADMAVYWKTSASTVFQFSATRTSTDADGRTVSPVGSARSPGFSDIVAATADAYSPPVRLTVFGHLDLVESGSDLIAGWRHFLTVLPRVPHAAPAEFSLFNPGNITIAESGTADYVWEDGRPFVLPAGTAGVRFTFSNSMVGIDTLRATGQFFKSSTRVFRFAKGRLVLSGLQHEMTVGDSLPLTLSVADQQGRMTGDLVAPTTFPHLLSGGLAISQGGPQTEIMIASRTSDVYYLKALAPGSQTLRIAHPNYELLDAAVNVRPAILGAFELTGENGVYAAGWSYPLAVRRSGSLTDEVKALVTSRNRLTVVDNLSGAMAQPGSNMGYFLVPGAEEKLLTMLLDGPGEDTIIVEAPGYVPDTLVVTSQQSQLSIIGLPASMSVGDSAVVKLSIITPSGAPPNSGMSSSQALTISAPPGLEFSYGGQPVTSLDAREGATFQVKAIAGGSHTFSFSHRDYLTLTGQVTVSAPIIDPDPQAGFQFVINTSPGATTTRSTIINNAGSGVLRNMRIKGGFVANCYNGQQANWITATFTEDVVPVVMHLKVSPPSGFPLGQSDFCYTLAADGAPDRSYGVRLNLEPPQPGQNVTIDDLGTFDGTGDSQAFSINDAGRIVGTSNSAAFYRDSIHSAIQYIPNPYGGGNLAVDVNASGLVAGLTGYVGWVYNVSTAAFQAAPPAFPQTNASNAVAINNTGQVLACADNGSYAQNFIWTLSSNETTLIPNAVNWCYGGLNNAGFAITSADPGAGGAAWLWDPMTKVATRLPSLGGITVGTDINSSNIVVGWSNLEDGNRRAFRYDAASGQIQNLGTLGGTESVALGINDSGAIVGWSNNASGEKRAFVWFPATGKMQDLGTLSGHDESVANEINGNNVAVGYSSTGGVPRAVRWRIQ